MAYAKGATKCGGAREQELTPGVDFAIPFFMMIDEQSDVLAAAHHAIDEVQTSMPRD